MGFKKWLRALIGRPKVAGKMHLKVSPIVDLRKIENDLASHRKEIEMRERMMVQESEKIGRLRQIEIDLEKRLKSENNKQLANRLKGTQRALKIARERVDQINEQLKEFDHFETALIVERAHAKERLKQKRTD